MKLTDLPENLRKQLGLEKAHKFGVSRSKLKRTEDGIVFASVFECRVYRALCRNLKHGKVDMVLQPKFELQAKFKNPDGVSRRAIHYVADFMIAGATPLQRHSFTDPVPQGAVVIDVKGHMTREFKHKQKLFEMRYGRLFVISTLDQLGRMPWSDYGIELKREFFL